MKEEELKIIDEFIEGFEPWHSSMEMMMPSNGEKSSSCFVCGIDPQKIVKLKEAVEKMRDHNKAMAVVKQETWDKAVETLIDNYGDSFVALLEEAKAKDL